MRNVLIHGYAQVNNQTVWHAATTDIAEIAATAQVLLNEHDPPGAPTWGWRVRSPYATHTPLIVHFHGSPL